jgi:transcriptional regulator with XRE-family HTH domain
MNTELIEELEKKKDLKGWSRTQLAAALGVSENYFYRIKDGSRKPGAEFLRAVINLFPDMEAVVLRNLKNGNSDGNTNTPTN